MNSKLELAVLLLLTIVISISLTACASVKHIGLSELNAFFEDISKSRSEIKTFKVEKVDVYLIVTIKIKDNLQSNDRDKIFKLTRDFMEDDDTRKVVYKHLKLHEDEGARLYSRLSVRFENVNSKDYWVYSKDLESGKWKVVESYKNKKEVFITPVE